MTGDLRKWLAFGTGVGIEIREEDLEVTVVRVRPRQVRILGVTTIPRFRQRPASEWGAEYAEFLRKTGGSHLAATVLLPRREITVRHLSLPGVARRDLDAAIAFQLDSLHPYPEEQAVSAWARLTDSRVVVVGIARSAVIERYALLFAEAGIRVASFTFSATVAYSAMRLLSTPPAAGVLALEEHEGALEVYGESPARPVFSALFDLPSEKAVALAAAELRLEGEVEPVRLQQLLPAPDVAPGDYDFSRAPLSYATALAGACPRLALQANLLPAQQRSSSSRAVYIPTIVLASLLLIAVALLAAQNRIEDRRYLSALRTEIARLMPRAEKVAERDRAIEAMSGRVRLLDDVRRRSKADLDALLELTRILEPPLWLRGLQMTPTNVSITGDAEQAAPLLKLLDNSPLFRDSQFTQPMVKVENGESFTIRSGREGLPEGGRP